METPQSTSKRGDTVVLRLRPKEFAELQRLAEIGQMCGSKTRRAFNVPAGSSLRAAGTRCTILLNLDPPIDVG